MAPAFILYRGRGMGGMENVEGHSAGMALWQVDKGVGKEAPYVRII